MFEVGGKKLKLTVLNHLLIEFKAVPLLEQPLLF